MTVYELIGQEAKPDWASYGDKVRLGLFTTAEKAEAKIQEIKEDKHWYMDWDSFRVVPVEVE